MKLQTIQEFISESKETLNGKSLRSTLNSLKDEQKIIVTGLNGDYINTTVSKLKRDLSKENYSEDSGILSVKVVKENKEETIYEKLTIKDGMGKWIADFEDSKAPQFKGKSKEERRKMAVAAFTSEQDKEK